MEINKETGKIIVAADEATSVPNIFAIGDISEVGVMSECHQLCTSRVGMDNMTEILFHDMNFSVTVGLFNM